MLMSKTDGSRDSGYPRPRLIESLMQESTEIALRKRNTEMYELFSIFYCTDNRRNICNEITILYEPERVNCCLCPVAGFFDGLPLYIFVPCPTTPSKSMTYKTTNKSINNYQSFCRMRYCDPIGINFLHHGPLRAPQRSEPRALNSVADAEKR